MIVDSETLKRRVLNWVRTMQTGPARFRMNAGADGSIYTSCFALFIFDLFNETRSFTREDSDAWINAIQSRQDARTGFFLPENHSGALNTKPVHQLTAFCLSALDILGASPARELKFTDQWMRPGALSEYLREKGCLDGAPGSGNMAMFVAIFLTWRYERQGDPAALDMMNEWLRLHEAARSRSTGFWGSSMSKRYYSGFQNAYHQFEIYNYWGRDAPDHRRSVDIVLSLQAPDGHFAPVPGGGGCMDYDAAHILIHLGYGKGYRKQDVRRALTRLLKAVMKNRNPDGGFCETRKRPDSPMRVFRTDHLRFIFSGVDPYPWYFRLRKTVSGSRKKRAVIRTHWTRIGRKWDQSDLWNTWFRCLTIASIETALEPSNSSWNFQKCVGLGFYDNRTLET